MRIAPFISKTTGLRSWTRRNTARAIAAAIAGENFDLIVTGLQSDDFGAAQTGVLLAEILGIPHATIIIGIEKTDTGLKLKRELEAGHYQHIEMTLPAVLTIQSGINKLRYATLIGIKQAKNKPMRKVAWAEVEGEAEPKHMQKIEKLYVPGSQKQTRKIEAPAGRGGEAAGGVSEERGAGVIEEEIGNREVWNQETRIRTRGTARL